MPWKMLILGDPETLSSASKMTRQRYLLVAEAFREAYISIFLLCEYVDQQ